MLLILSGFYGLPLKLHNQVFKFNSMKSECGEGIKNSFSVLSIKKAIDICLCIQDL